MQRQIENAYRIFIPNSEKPQNLLIIKDMILDRMQELETKYDHTEYWAQRKDIKSLLVINSNFLERLNKEIAKGNRYIH